ncbi:uncharacterized protein LOC122086365 [Macadamia integrifolia]|uniref:uncharacterized protein LOC122086365 n=1 Tax=Macadamia integrifolia TaxID=60698 RepID=UPI001C4F4132|nr:uncharacterized protein LOC122086365 [Macadamia integrifolia]XP_042511066.1 uncharacterized protein LOC122086365 [Macadamia integrifolia]XP_042511067.1 uncharacterized protein LOC122086365 [Macadamia integrifolia]XP_042511068.1 uncharacterized protein LOC122086365 [Macadamia integrifolia]XP_042511069.1 uncharacterized protein LOC122086365 [Macadamia integrifolia]XP_042511070.1 uncharacterized protein LOC122086365 [Macadamia integrifolia]XP_042511071.1 uncharacterized protein LOC122086365 [
MSSNQNTRLEMLQWKRQSDPKNGLGKNHKQATKSCTGTCDMQVHDSKASAGLNYKLPHDIPNSEEQFSNKINLVAVMEEFCNQFHDTQEAHLQHENVGKFSDVQGSTSLVKHTHLDKLNMQTSIPEKLSEATEAFLNQKFIEAEQQNRGHQAKLFMDALEMLNSNKELFLKFLQDPNSPLVKHIEDLQDAQAVAGRTKLSPEEKMGNSRECEELISEKKLQKQNVHAFFRRKIKSQKIKPSKGSDSPQALNNKVLLKPGPKDKQNSATETSPNLRTEEPRVKNNSHFFFTEIGKKLKHVMGESRKEQRWPPILRRVPSKHPESEASKEKNEDVTERGSPRESNFHIGRITDPSINVEGRGKLSQSKDLEPSQLKDHEPIIGYEVAPTSVDGQNITMKSVENFKQSESHIYIEAVKHLSDIVSTRKEDINLSSGQIPKTLGRILSLPEYNVSPIFSPGRDKEHGSVTAEMRVQPHDNVQLISENVWQLKEDNGSGNLIPLRQNIHSPPCNIDHKADRKLQVPDSNSNISQQLSPDRKIQESICSAKEFSPEADINAVEITNIEHPEEYIPLEICPEPDCITAFDTTNRSIDTTKTFEEEETSECLRLDSPEENQSSSSASGPSSPSSVIIQKFVDREGITDKPEQPSPVSVLEPFIIEDATSPGSFISQPVEPPIQPLQIHLGEYDSSALLSASPDPEIYVSCVGDKKFTFDFVKAVLRISGFSSWDEFMGRSQYTDQLLAPSLFDEVEALSDQLCSDPKELFDCINEVLVEVYERYFACSPWVSFGKPNIRPVPVGKNLIREVWEGIDCQLLPQNQPLALDQILEKDMAKAGKWMDLRFDFELISNEMGDIILEELTAETIYELCT